MAKVDTQFYERAQKRFNIKFHKKLNQGHHERNFIAH